MKHTLTNRRRGRPGTLSSLIILMGTSLSAQAQAPIRLPGHAPAAVATARALGRVAAQEPIHLALTLPLRDQADLDDLLARLYNPSDPLYGQYLTSAQFAERYGPTQADYDAVAAFARSRGLTVTATHSNRAVLDVAGPAGMVEAAFGLHLLRYQGADGRLFHAPDAVPAVPADIAARLTGVVGLDDAQVWHTHNRRLAPDPLAAPSLAPALTPYVLPSQIGSGPGGGLTPSDIKTAYNLNDTTLTGGGQTLGLFELDGYTPSDITTYEDTFGLPHVPLQNVLVDGYSGAAGADAVEVTLDIELQTALAPGASQILVYEAPNSSRGVIDTYNRIASDNLAKQISTSWGLAEDQSMVFVNEYPAFKQMAAQGQTIYAASGDEGAYDDGSSLSVDDPASQPYMTGVGGTQLTTAGPGGTWSSETTWNGGGNPRYGGGGGISTLWAIPSWQQGVISPASQGSTTMRNVPDVALTSDPTTGYAVYIDGQWQIYGGTSCASPCWAGFTALVNEQRAANGSPALGFASPALYALGKGARGGVDFHDIADGSTNRYYPAVLGFDLATGWGSFNGLNLLPDLVASAPYTEGGGGTTGTQLLGNPGFENGTYHASPWVISAESLVHGTSATEPAHSGAYLLWLAGYSTPSYTDTVYQQATIPSTTTSATLSFWLHADTPYFNTAPYVKTVTDTLKVQIRSSTGKVLATLATYSNQTPIKGYAQKSFDVTAYKGKTIQVCLVCQENYYELTRFAIDDFALNAQ